GEEPCAMGFGAPGLQPSVHRMDAQPTAAGRRSWHQGSTLNCPREGFLLDRRTQQERCAPECLCTLSEPWACRAAARCACMTSMLAGGHGVALTALGGLPTSDLFVFENRRL